MFAFYFNLSEYIRRLETGHADGNFLQGVLESSPVPLIAAHQDRGKLTNEEEKIRKSTRSRSGQLVSEMICLHFPSCHKKCSWRICCGTRGCCSSQLCSSRGPNTASLSGRWLWFHFLHEICVEEAQCDGSSQDRSCRYTEALLLGAPGFFLLPR